jgi:predicted alpha-1,2-mannosidase
MKRLLGLSAVLLPVLMIAVTAAQGQNARWVDPMLGASGGGNVFVGPLAPFGMIKPGPDMTTPHGDDANAGWAEHGAIHGFSQTHVSGTGGGPRYGNILVQATTGAVTPMDMSSPRADEKAHVGYYGVTLSRFGVGVEITAAARSALYRFTYPKSGQANLLFDVSRCLLAHHIGTAGNESQIPVGSNVYVVSPTEIEGSSSVKGGWNFAPSPYTVYFYAKTDVPAATWGTWRDGTLFEGNRSLGGGPGTKLGAWMTFAATGKPVLMKIGISFVSVAQARKNVDAEIPGFDFAATEAGTAAKWDKALGTVELKGESDEQRQMFYTALYHTMMQPTDRTGENPMWTSNEPYYDDYYAIWDIFRTSGPLLTLIAPEREDQIVRGLVDLYRHEGWLTDARAGNYNGRTQGGSNAEFMLTDAYVKGLPGIDWQEAYKAEVQDAEAMPPDPEEEGRGGIKDWLKLGYVSVEGFDKPSSTSVEYAANDFEVALLAKGLGETADYEKYLKRSGNWKNLWDASFSESGFTGFIRSRHQDGSWLTPFTAMDECSWNGKTFYEGNSWTYSFFAPQDEAAVMKAMGGPETFVNRLDAFFAVKGRYDVGNEPGFLTPYLYNWAGRPDKTAEHVREIIAESYHAGESGLPGNDDSGAMSSWFAFGQLGFFPNAGQDVYVIGSPAYPESTIHLGNGKDFTVEAKGVSEKNIYVTAATLNGKPLERSWLRHREIMAGGTLVLTMSDKPNTWGQKDVPPSTPAE